MQLSITLVPGHTWTAGELVTEDKLNATGNPTINPVIARLEGRSDA